jgi:hypothetical protein
VSARSLLAGLAMVTLASGCNTSSGGGVGGELVGQPRCSNPAGLVLIAQAVPAATSLPCIEGFPPGWTLSQGEIRTQHASFTLESMLSGLNTAQVLLTPACDIAGATPDPALALDERGTQKYVRETVADPRLGIRLERFFRFPGGCVTYRYEFAPGTPGSTALVLDADLGFLDRAQVVSFVAARTHGLEPCGAGASC